MTFFLRAVEEAEGGWVCKRGRSVLDRHPNIESALDHLRALANEVEGQCTIVVHRRDDT